MNEAQQHYERTRNSTKLKYFYKCNVTKKTIVYSLLTPKKLNHTFGGKYPQVSVAVALARPLHVSKVGQSKQKGNTKQATFISDIHAHGSKCTLWLIRLARS